ncbi:hypothetical protein Acr_03g0011670 [Actinidia rufa]|uniref:Uncharacterized protein n=1 Tax=Actinidia rufa TaxID=165716 RepID=A0A7J0ED43_9ERIC|nr:hypothetical protein Acr_03g0011670 [Actinidia rufa]
MPDSDPSFSLTSIPIVEQPIFFHFVFFFGVLVMLIVQFVRSFVRRRLVVACPPLMGDFNDLIEGTAADLKRLREEIEGESTGSNDSSSSSSLSSWDIDLGGIVPEPILMPSSNSESVDDLHFPDIGSTAKLLIEHSFNQGDSSGSSLEEEVDMAPKQRALGKKKAAKGEPPRQVPNLVLAIPSLSKAPKLAVVELEKELTSVDSSKDHETCLALGKAVMLHQDVAKLAEEDSEGFRGRLAAVHACDEVEAAIEEKNKALQEVTELRKVASNEELGTSSDHPAWNAPAPPIEPPALSVVYSPILLLDFNEAEYANEPAEGEEADNAGEGVGAVGIEGVEAEGENVPTAGEGVVTVVTEGMEAEGENEGENMPKE